ncbi:uncharacterized protein METZ01_LOCUS400868, partial [marine metagenome]
GLPRHAPTDRRGNRRGRVAAYGRPRRHGRPWLLHNRGPPQGHDHPRGREHLPQGTRRDAARAPDRGRGRRCGSARRQVRRGRRRLRPRGSWRDHRRGRTVRLCPRAARPTQDTQALDHRRRVPSHRLGQDPEIRPPSAMGERQLV